jgi:hypothetical protein
MPSINKPILRLALAIHAQLIAGEKNEPLVELPNDSWNRCSELVRQIRRAQLRGWHLAAHQLRSDLSYSMISVSDQLAPIREHLPRSTIVEPTMSASDLYRDLLALRETFEDMEFDLAARRLSVTTEAIELEGVYLGSFEIQLLWSRPLQGSPPAYRVLAKDPHPAQSRDNVTHPHVMDEVLCEGDGHRPIRKALAQGRLLDFFTLVHSVLRTYNSESPFVELALWSGSTCSDCGAVVDEEYSYSCHRCGDTICGECETNCGGCDESCCSGCIGSCPVCEEAFCRPCLTICEGCQRRICSGCLVENERCTRCHEEESQEEEPADAQVQPHGVGQVIVPA